MYSAAGTACGYIIGEIRDELQDD
jgi:hypothetical protein